MNDLPSIRSSIVDLWPALWVIAVFLVAAWLFRELRELEAAPSLSPGERGAAARAVRPSGLLSRTVADRLARHLPGWRHRLAALFLVASLSVFAWYDWLLRFIAILLLCAVLLAAIRWRISRSQRGGDGAGAP